MAAPLPVEVRVDKQVVGVLIIKQVGPQILVRADDLPGSGLALPLTCAAGQHLSLPGELNPQLDTTLMLRLGRNALQVQASEPDLPTPDSLQTTGSLSADSDTCLRVQPETVAGAGDVQALGVRSSSTFDVHLADGKVFTQASVADTYLYWQRGLLEADFGLIPAGVQSDLGA